MIGRPGMLHLLGNAILLLTAAALSLHVPGCIWVGTLARKDAVVALMLASAALWALAATRVQHTALSLPFVLAIAAALRLMLLPAPPFMSSDIYRYVWDGRVQRAGINPYAHIPADPALAGLRDQVIYPRINRADYAHTIYPPAAQLLFAAIGRLMPTVTGMKAAMLLLEAGGIAAMLALLRQARMPAARILIYAWNPLPAWAIAADGHIDGAMIGLLGLAVWAACAQPSGKRQRGLAGALFAGAVLTKFFPLLVAPALWRRSDWAFPAASAATLLALYALYAGVGWQVFGFLGAYTHEEGLRAGNGFFLLAALSHLAPLPSWAQPVYLACAALALAALGARIAFRPPGDSGPVQRAADLALLAFCAMILFSPHYPWYFAWLAWPACLVPWSSLLFLAAAPLLLYADPWHDQILIEACVFVPALALAARDVWRAAPRLTPVPAGE